MTPDLTDDDKAILVELLRDTIARDRFPLSPRVKRLRGILAKLGGRLGADRLPGLADRLAG